MVEVKFPLPLHNYAVSIKAWREGPHCLPRFPQRMSLSSENEKNSSSQAQTGSLSQSTCKVKRQQGKDPEDKKSLVTLRGTILLSRGGQWSLRRNLCFGARKNLLVFIYLTVIAEWLNCSVPQVSSSFGKQATMMLHSLKQPLELIIEKSRASARCP